MRERIVSGLSMVSLVMICGESSPYFGPILAYSGLTLYLMPGSFSTIVMVLVLSWVLMMDCSVVAAFFISGFFVQISISFIGQRRPSFAFSLAARPAWMMLNALCICCSRSGLMRAWFGFGQVKCVILSGIFNCGMLNALLRLR